MMCFSAAEDLVGISLVVFLMNELENRCPDPLFPLGTISLEIFLKALTSNPASLLSLMVLSRSLLCSWCLPSARMPIGSSIVAISLSLLIIITGKEDLTSPLSSLSSVISEAAGSISEKVAGCKSGCTISNGLLFRAIYCSRGRALLGISVDTLRKVCTPSLPFTDKGIISLISSSSSSSSSASSNKYLCGFCISLANLRVRGCSRTSRT
mmetsp:Transcript_30569/g.50815  ORF Transcript_30569/g.50815 Transcript_30569/m.50815 type:complete len:210 (+) Transcript_30569:1814-2443(+)